MPFPLRPNRTWLLPALLMVTAFIAYLPVLNGAPIWDDDHHLTGTALQSLHGLQRIWLQPGATPQYYPLVHTVFWVEKHLWGYAPLGYHLLNILLHLCSVLLLVKILQKLRIPGAWLAGALFALHPIEVESVAWMTELKNVLSGVFFFAALLMYLHFDRQRDKKGYWLALGFFFCGLLAKSVVATLPMALLAIFWWKRGKLSLKSDILPLLPFLLIGAVSGLFTAWVERRYIGAAGDEFHFTLLERVLIAGRAFWFYLDKLFLPVRFAFIYPRWQISQSAWWQYLFPVAALLLGIGLWMIRRKSRAPLAAYGYYAAMLFPAAGFLNVYPFRYSFVADHFQYLAGIGPLVLFSAAAAGIAGRKLWKQKFLTQISPMILLGGLALATFLHSRTFADAETLYRDTIRLNPGCFMAYSNLGIILDRQGRSEEAVTCYREALRYKPDFMEASYNLGNDLLFSGHAEEALAYYERTIKLEPRAYDAWFNMGCAYMQIGRADEAAIRFREALKINPADFLGCYNLGNALVQLNRPGEALQYFDQALEHDPSLPGVDVANSLIGGRSSAPAGNGNPSALNPLYLRALRSACDACLRAGRPEKALQTAQRARDLAMSAGMEALAVNIGKDIARINMAQGIGVQAAGAPKKP